MDQKHKEYIKTLHVGHVRPEEIPWRRLGQCEFTKIGHIDYSAHSFSQDLYRVLEDGSQTQMRLCIIESLIPPRSDGPVFHFHEMHDEGFIVTVRISLISVLSDRHTYSRFYHAERQDPLSHPRRSAH